MSRLIKSQDYLMKSLGIVLLLVFVSLGAIAGCNNNGNGGEQGSTQALIENDFANDPELFANPEKGVVVSFLESETASESENITGRLGFDLIPFRYTQTVNHTFCFEDDNDASAHLMVLQDSDGQEVLRASANGGCVTGVLEAGDYEVVLVHGEHVEGIEPVFLIPALEEGQLTERDRQISSGFARFIRSMSNILTRPALAQSDASDNVTTLISTNACENCDLMGVDLSDKDLSGAKLEGANLAGSDLSGADFSVANISAAILTDVDFSRADLSKANLSGSNLTGSDLAGVNLEGAGFGNTILIGTILSFATWVNGFTCDIFSIGVCNTYAPNLKPCASLAGSESDGIVKCLLPPLTDNTVDLVDVALLVFSGGFNLTQDTQIAIMAWGGEGGLGTFGIAGGGVTAVQADSRQR